MYIHILNPILTIFPIITQRILIPTNKDNGYNLNKETHNK